MIAGAPSRPKSATTVHQHTIRSSTTFHAPHELGSARLDGLATLKHTDTISVFFAFTSFFLFFHSLNSRKQPLSQNDTNEKQNHNARRPPG